MSYYEDCFDDYTPPERPDDNCGHDDGENDFAAGESEVNDGK